MNQNGQERALLKFKKPILKILITTDLAARGWYSEVEYIIHYQLPLHRRYILHRNGVTARMNAKGTAYLILADEEKYPFLKGDIETEI